MDASSSDSDFEGSSDSEGICLSDLDRHTAESVAFKESKSFVNAGYASYRLRKSANITKISPNEKIKLLTAAVAHSDLDLVKKLFKSGLPKEFPNTEEWQGFESPLCVAIKCTPYLLEDESNAGEDPLLTLKYLIDNGNKVTGRLTENEAVRLPSSASKNSGCSVKLRSRIKKESTSNIGVTASSTEDSNAPGSERDQDLLIKNTGSPLDLAIQLVQIPVVALLLEHGAPATEDALKLLAHGLDMDALQVVIDLGVNLIDHNDLLFDAAMSGIYEHYYLEVESDLAFLEMLFDVGIKIPEDRCIGEEVISMTSSSASSRCRLILSLLRQGLDLNQENKRNEGLMDVVFSKLYPKSWEDLCMIVKFLIMEGLDLEKLASNKEWCGWRAKYVIQKFYTEHEYFEDAIIEMLQFYELPLDSGLYLADCSIPLLKCFFRAGGHDEALFHAILQQSLMSENESLYELLSHGKPGYVSQSGLRRIYDDADDVEDQRSDLWKRYKRDVGQVAPLSSWSAYTIRRWLLSETNGCSILPRLKLYLKKMSPLPPQIIPMLTLEIPGEEKDIWKGAWEDYHPDLNWACSADSESSEEEYGYGDWGAPQHLIDLSAYDRNSSDSDSA